MRILHIIDSGGMYGAEIMLLNLAKEQLKQGFDVVVGSIGTHGCDEKNLETELKIQGVKVKKFRMRAGPNFFGSMRIIRYAKASNTDIIHSHGYKGNILLGMIPRRLRKIPMISTVHGWTSTKAFSKIKIYELFDRISLRCIDAVILVNKNMLYLSSFQNRQHKYIQVIDNGISVESDSQIQIRKDIVDFCRGKIIVGGIGRLSDEKGFDVLIDAFNEVSNFYRDIRLLILGDGPQRGCLEEKIRRLGMEEQVYMPGFVDGANHYLNLFKLLVIPSLSEGLPITLLEAMRHGVPVIASSVGGIPDVLDRGKCGILVPPGDKASLTVALTRSLQADQDIALLAEKAKSKFINHYSSNRMCLEYSDIYSRLISL